MDTRLRHRLEARVRRNPKDVVALWGLGRIARDSGELLKSRQLLEAALRVDPADPDTLEILAFTLLFAGETNLAGGTFNRHFTLEGFQMSPANALRQYGAGVTLQRLGHAQKGGEFKENALRLLPEAAEWFELLQRCALRKR